MLGGTDNRGGERGMLRCGGDFGSSILAVAIVVRAHTCSELQVWSSVTVVRVLEGCTECNKYSV